MKWTAKILTANKDVKGLKLDIMVEFTNGSVVKTVPFEISDVSSIKRILKNQVKQYEEIESASIVIGDVDLTPDPVIEPPIPTQEELDLIAYNKARAELVQLKQDLDLKLIDQPAYELKVQEVKILKP